MSTVFQQSTIELTNELTREPQQSGSLSEQELRGIVDAIPHLIIVLNADGSPIYANKFVMDYTGLTDEEVRRQGVRTRVFHPDDLPELERRRGEGMAAGQPF